ncbi:hypothetical protein QEZ54_08565 [Catellatospora sp. KI3]|nr:hypothetical protein [Catellatospora sp. KI3]MDI1461014.1 hypothetical protein [Catellatospora sp. KI3]
MPVALRSPADQLMLAPTAFKAVLDDEGASRSTCPPSTRRASRRRAGRTG